MLAPRLLRLIAMRLLFVLRFLLLALLFQGCGGIVVIPDEDDGATEDVELAPSQARWTFELPSEGVPNDNEYIGPFCCTGVTAVVIGDDGEEIAYAYFFGWDGDAYQIGDTSYAPDFKILLSARTDLEDHEPPQETEEGELAFTAGEVVAGFARSEPLGAFQFTATIEHADVAPGPDGPVIDMASLAVRLDVDLVE